MFLVQNQYNSKLLDMKKTVLVSCCLLSGILPIFADNSGGLLLESCSFGERPFTAPLSEISFVFNDCISVLAGASASVTCEGETVATPIGFEVYNYKGQLGKEGTLAVIFEEQYLPKGKSYTVSIAPGSISAEDDFEIKNQEIIQSFEIPESLGPGRCEMEDGSIISTVSESVYHMFPSFYWHTEIEPVGEPYFILYREGIAVREIPTHTSWDWNLGTAYAEVSETMNFEQGVHFSLVLPEGSVHAMYREDIVNDEVVFNFIGGYTDPIPAITYDWCSLFSDHSNVLNEVTFTYSRPVHLAENAVIQLWYADESELVMEAPAYINTDVNCWAISADFGGYEMTSEKGYTLIIPEGTLLAENGDPVINQRCSIPLGEISKIKQISNSNGIDSPIYDLNGHIVKTPESGKVYIKDGKTVVLK